MPTIKTTDLTSLSRRTLLRWGAGGLLAGGLLSLLPGAPWLSAAQATSGPRQGQGQGQNQGQTQGQKQGQTQGQASANAPKALIVYYSRSGNTRAVAQHIRDLIGADMLEIQTVTPYPTEHRPTGDLVKKQLAEGIRPPLSTKIPDLKAYDLIFIGSPNWYETITPPMMTFLAENNLAHKTIAPFMTHAGSGLGRGVEDIKKLCPAARVTQGLAIQGSRAANSREAVAAWLTALSAPR